MAGQVALKCPANIRGDADKRTIAAGMFGEYVLMEPALGVAQFRKQAETFFIWRSQMSDFFLPPSRTTGSVLTLDRVPDFVPGRFSVWLFTKHERKDGQRIEAGGKA